MTNFYRYTTLEGERWDNVAIKYRPNAYDYVDIIEANPSYQDLFIIPTGAIISIPIKEESIARVKPPWEV